MSDIPERPYKWGTDDTFDDGPAVGRNVRSKPAGWPEVGQGAVPGTAAAVPHVNQVLGVTGDWLNYLSEIQLQNWSESVALGTTNPIISSCYLASAKVWIGVGDEESIVSNATGKSWSTLGTPTGISFTRIFAGNAKAVALDGSANVRATTGSGAWLTNEEATGDVLVGGIYETNGGHYIVAGADGAGTVEFLFLNTDTEGDVGTADMNRLVLGAVPALGTSGDDVRDVLAQDRGVYFADRGDGRVICLMSLRDSMNLQSTVYQFVSTDGGENFTTTADVITPTDATAATGIKGLGYDSERDLWVAVTGDGRLFTSPASAESWTEIATGLGDAPHTGGPSAIDSLVVVNGLYVTTLNPSGEDYIMWSRDGGVTWRFWVVDPGIVYESIAFAKERGQWLLTGSTATAYLSLSVGPAPAVAA